MLTRRQLLQLSAAMLALPVSELFANDLQSKLPLIQKEIPSSGEMIPAVGMGTSRTFNMNGDPESLAKLKAVITAFFAAKGMVIDSSPMYGSAETRVGDILRDMKNHPKVFAATKVWTSGREEGIAAMEVSAKRMNVDRFDLIGVHNLVDWRTQLDTLKNWKKEGKVKYIGITTSHGRDHDEFVQIMKNEPIDFVQFSYNMGNQDAERELLPTARDKGIAVMINRPYQRGSLFRQSKGKALPEMAKDIDCTSWGQFYLKYILGHPDITCVIPATSKAKHMVDNMQANFGRLPEASQRKEMLMYFNNL